MLASAVMTAQAQFAGGSSSNSSHSYGTDAPEAYNDFTISYDANFYSGKGALDEGCTAHGVALQYTHGWRVSDTQPMYVDIGVRLGMTFYFDISRNLQKLSSTVPINFGYRFTCSEPISIMPYTGIHLKGNILGRYKLEYYDYDESEWVSMFDKDEVGKDAQWKRFQIGWQIGAKANFNKFVVGLEYGLDFNALAKKCNTSNLLVSIGINF